MDKINIFILLHMHQPVYRLMRDNTAYYSMPWVYLHGVNEYYDIPSVIGEFDDVHITFNLVPSLLIQLQDYIKGAFKDDFVSLFLKPAEDLDAKEREFVLRNFFSVNYYTKMKKSKRYLYLFDKRGSVYELDRKASLFTVNEIRDLQMLFFLYNTSLIAGEEFSEIQEWKKKDMQFTEEDKNRLYEIHHNILGRVIPLYKRLYEERKIELSTTPFTHPISPLLLDLSICRASNPYLNCPDFNARFPDNVDLQMERALETFKKLFGKAPLGMWPAEGSVSDAFLDIMIQKGIKWTATDEGILEKSLGYSVRETFSHELYSPHEYNGLTMMFRDRELSDDIGFNLYRMPPKEASYKLTRKISKIFIKRGKLVSIILDGENPWENYEGGGVPFLRKLFGHAITTKKVNFVTGEWVANNMDKLKISHIHPGSWIRSDFSTWIGQKEKNTAWEYLIKVKNDTREIVKSNKEALFELMSAEGSDWFWWFGDDNPTAYANEFDQLFREHLKDIYRMQGLDYPEFLDKPIKREVISSPVIKPETGFITPVIDGKITDFFEWLGAGLIDLTKTQGGVMRSSQPMFKYLHYGRDSANFYMLLEPFEKIKTDFIFQINIKSRDKLLVIDSSKKNAQDIVFKIGRVVEIKIPLNYIEDKNNIEISAEIKKKGEIQERYPHSGSLHINLIDEDEAEDDWMV